MPMSAVCEAFTAAGGGEVATFIQTGNVLFDARPADTARIVERARASRRVVRRAARNHAADAAARRRARRERAVRPKRRRADRQALRRVPRLRAADPAGPAV